MTSHTRSPDCRRNGPLTASERGVCGGVPASTLDPALMSRTERMAELGAHMAAGYRRSRLRANGLDVLRQAEPSCISVNAKEQTP